MTNEPSKTDVTKALAVGSVLYALLLCVGLVWLWLRDRLDVLPEMAVGIHGPWLASGLGLVVGYVGALILRGASPHVRVVAELERQSRELFGQSNDTATMAFLLIGVVAEAIFFRLAVQDAVGLVGAVAVYSLLHGSIGGFAWIPFTAVLSLVLGLFVQQGFGLLGSATAHAIMNYCSLRRILCTPG